MQNIKRQQGTGDTDILDVLVAVILWVIIAVLGSRSNE